MSSSRINSEFLIHAADVEGLCQGVDEELVRCEFNPETASSGRSDQIQGLGKWVRIPTTYAGGAKGTPLQQAA